MAVLDAASVVAEEVQLASTHGEGMLITGVDAVTGGVGRQLGGNRPLGRAARDYAVKDPLGPEIFHALDHERKLGKRRSVQHLARQEMLRPEAKRPAVALDEIHRRGAEERGHELVGRLVIDLRRRAELTQRAMVDHGYAIP